MNNPHISNLISSYVLDLLSPRERAEVEQHAATCAHCRHELQAEREIGAAVRRTLAAATRPAPGRLWQLMPTPPARRLLWLVLHRFSGPARTAIAGVCLALMLLFSTLQPGVVGNGGAPAYSTTMAATATYTPTATNTAVAGETQRDTQPADLLLPPTNAAGPMGTPVAVILTVQQN